MNRRTNSPSDRFRAQCLSLPLIVCRIVKYAVLYPFNREYYGPELDHLFHVGYYRDLT